MSSTADMANMEEIAGLPSKATHEQGFTRFLCGSAPKSHLLFATYMAFSQGTHLSHPQAFVGAWGTSGPLAWPCESTSFWTWPGPRRRLQPSKTKKKRLASLEALGFLTQAQCGSGSPLHPRKVFANARRGLGRCWSWLGSIGRPGQSRTSQSPVGTPSLKIRWNPRLF